MGNHLAALSAEIKNRARIYALIYREISREVGREKAMDILKKALYARGKEKGLQLAEKIGSPDLHQLALAFVEGKGDMDAFGHEIVEEHSDYVILRLNQCPLVEAWKELELSSEEQKTMCDIAYQIDFGKFETAGYKLAFTCRIADGSGSCDMCLKL
jgi:hypothetical protein